ncbi:Ectonucleotide pyrophosphatase/phosphodiesterase family member 6 [Portunus trituberculatus]|uniref:Ectonucleotide pyrophosphatase/phosphodiesterase family member 6 n=1 Tax=Portunus trituberculatus TaxID=210409 RepID=A0A5B7ILJ2_PORTR|nr:Ectonucleotide pyrophosphatase/phosphodiesterase family member 6 [Portunus trituberculatus]
MSFQVFSQVSQIPGVSAYRHADIPDRYHFRNSPYIYDIILVAKKGKSSSSSSSISTTTTLWHYIMASRSDKQLPRRTDSYVSVGGHGYDPDDMNMKGIFFARGPAFDCGSVVEPIHVVDVYQVLTHVLHLTPLPHNGTWSHVEPIFRTYDSVCSGADRCFLSLSSVLLLTLMLLARQLMN